MPTEINWKSTEVKSRAYSWDMKGMGVSAFEKFCDDCILVSTHAMLAAVLIEKIISGTGAVPIATAFSFFQNF